MTSVKDNPELLEEWRQLKDKLSYRSIGKLYGVSASTVQYWLIPGFKEHRIAHDRDYRHKKKIRASKISNYHKKYKSRPEVKPLIAAYDSRYKTLIRHIDNFILENFTDNGKAFSSNDISDSISKKNNEKEKNSKS